MTSKCAREECGKTVYPLEELKCLDKVWHKQCFKCHSCGMTLSMKTYKGFEKQPYCQAHYPKITPTAVTSTVEMDTAMANTKSQSQVQYHANYEKSKGQKIQIADDPELKRCMQNTKIQSQTEYHKEQDKKKEQDSNRPQHLASNESLSQLAASPNENICNSNGSEINGGRINTSTCSSAEAPFSYGKSLNFESPYSQRLAAQASGTIVYSTELGGKVEPENRKIGSIADYDPINGNKAANENGQGF